MGTGEVALVERAFARGLHADEEDGGHSDANTFRELTLLIVAIFCAGEVLDYVGEMDWQQMLALLIVAMTVGLFAWSKFRRKKFSFGNDTHCGCSSEIPPIGPTQTIQFRARKGERPTVVLKNR